MLLMERLDRTEADAPPSGKLPFEEGSYGELPFEESSYGELPFEDLPCDEGSYA